MLVFLGASAVSGSVVGKYCIRMYAEHEWIWNGYVLIHGGNCMSDFNVTNDFLHSIVGHCIGLVLA